MHYNKPNAHYHGVPPIFRAIKERMNKIFTVLKGNEPELVP